MTERGLLSSIVNHNFDQDGAMSRMGEPTYAFITRDYLNLNSRIGYHFSTVDVRVTEEPERNHRSLRFVGGSTGIDPRSRGALLIERILRARGFETDRAADLVNARLRHRATDDMREALRLVGLLMGYANHLDMELVSDEVMAAMGCAARREASWTRASSDRTGATSPTSAPVRCGTRTTARSPGFREVMVRGRYESDVSLGFRKFPHRVLAVREREAGRDFIPRATVDTDLLSALMREGGVESGADVFILNRPGTCRGGVPGTHAGAPKAARHRMRDRPQREGGPGRPSQGAFDGAVVDVTMPGMDKIGLPRRMRGDHPGGRGVAADRPRRGRTRGPGDGTRGVRVPAEARGPGRSAGGGAPGRGEPARRVRSLDFQTWTRGDILAARLDKGEEEVIADRLRHLGRRTLAARQRDMRMDPDESPARFAEAFLRGELDAG